MTKKLSQQIRTILKDKQKLEHLSNGNFDKLDSDKSGFLERVEIETALGNICAEAGCEKPTSAQIDAVLKKLDTSGDGKLDRAEFLAFTIQLLNDLANYCEAEGN